MDENMNNDVTCIVCYNTIEKENICKTNCNHIYCTGCLNEWLDRGNVDCPMCRSPVRSYLNDNIMNKIVVLKSQAQNLILFQPNTGYEEIIKKYRKRFNIFKVYFFLNTSYILYLHV